MFRCPFFSPNWISSSYLLFQACSKGSKIKLIDLNLNILRKATKYQKNMLKKRRKDNPYIMGDMEHGSGREKPKKTD